MSAETRKQFTTPVGRVVMGSLYKPRDKDAEGKPLLVKHGPNINQPRVDFFFAIAIKKGVETHWAQTSWGAIVWGVGHVCFSQAAQSPAFAWKIEDGDSTIPNKKGKKPVDQEGFKGHWILKFSGGFAPPVFKQENGQFIQVTDTDFVKPGFFVQVAVSVDGNRSDNQPGIYLNHQKVLFRGQGQEIVFGVSAEEAFGSAANEPLPAGASAIPLPASIPLPGTPAMFPVPTQAAPPPPAPVQVQPNPGFLAVAPPPPAALPAAPSVVPPPPASGPRMTVKANGVNRERYLENGWTEAQLIAEGYMTL